MSKAVDHPRRKGSSTCANRARPEFNCWRAMHYRCKHRKGYADRGIKVCARWQSFDAFVADMGPRPSTAHTIERKNNARGYTPANCVWATRAEQNQNKTNLLLIDGKNLAAWATALGVNYQAMHKRYTRYAAGRITKAQLLHPGAAHHWSKRHA